MSNRTAKEVATGADLDRARRAVEEITPKLIRLLRSIGDPGVSSVGDWTVGEVAAHLSHVCVVELAAAREGSGENALRDAGLPVPRELPDVTAMNAAALDKDPIRDPAALAQRIERSVDELVEACHGRDRVVSWILGVRLPISAVCCHLVSEIAVHGWDISTGAKLPWTIDGEHARLAIEGFYVPMVARIGGPDDGSTQASAEIRLRGGGRFVFAQTGSGVAVRSPDGKADLVLSVDPASMLLVMSGRIHPVSPALRGRMLAWGRHPIRAMKMLKAIRAP